MDEQARIQEIRQELARRNMHPSMGISPNEGGVQNVPTLDAIEVRKQELRQELARRAEFSYPRFIAEQAGKGALGLPDMALQGVDAAQEYGNYLNSKLASAMRIPAKPPYESILSQFQQLTGLERPSDIVPETQYPTTPTQRVVGHAARGAGAALVPIPGSSLTAIPRAMAMTGGAGALSGGLQEMGMPEIPSELVGIAGSALAPGMLAKGIRKWKGPQPGALTAKEAEVAEFLREKIGQQEVPNVYQALENHKPSPIGYEPTTAEIAQSPVLAQYHRAMQEVPGSGISEKLGVGNRLLHAEAEKHLQGAGIGATQEAVARQLEGLHSNTERAIEGLGNIGNPTEAGENIQAALQHQLTERVGIRRAATSTLRRQLNTMATEVPPTHIENYIKNSIERGELKSELDYVQKMLNEGRGSSGELTKKDIDYKNMYEKVLKQDPNLVKGLPVPKLQYPTVAGLSATRRAINGRLKRYGLEGKKSESVLLRQMRNEIDKDLAHIPEQRQYDSLYRQHSIPVSEITGHPTLGKIIKKNPKAEGLIMGPSSVPDEFLKKASRSIDDATVLLENIGSHPRALETLREEINRRTLNEIIDGKTGRVSANAIRKFRNNHPGVEILYPDLFNTRLRNVQNAQMAANHFMADTAKIYRTLERNALNQYVPKSSEKIISKIFNEDSPDNINSLIRSIGHDRLAMEGLRHESIYHFMESIKNDGTQGGVNKLSPYKMSKFLKQHGTALDTLLTPPQKELISEVEKALKGRRYTEAESVGQGSSTASRTALRGEIERRFSGAPDKYWGPLPIPRNTKEFLSAVGQSTPFVKKFFIHAAEERTAELTNILNKALVDPSLAKRMMSPTFKSQRDFNDFMNNVKRQSLPFISIQASKQAHNTDSEED